MSGSNVRLGKMGNDMKILTSLKGRDNKMLYTGISLKQPSEKRKTVEWKAGLFYETSDVQKTQ
jgi:hypothetical protein